MKILLITHFVPQVVVGGTEVLTLSLAEELRDAGHDVTLLCNTGWDEAKNCQIEREDDMARGIRVIRWKFGWRSSPHVFRYLYDNPEVESELVRLCEAEKPDIAHVTSCYTLSASVFNALKRARVPTLFTATDFWMLCARNTLLRHDGSLCSGPEGAIKCAECMLATNKLYRAYSGLLPRTASEWLTQSIGRAKPLTNHRVLQGVHGDWDKRLSYLINQIRSLAHIVTASVFLKDLFVQYGVDAERIQVLPYGLNLDRLHPKQKTRSAAIRFGFIGSMSPMKGPDIAIKAFRSLPCDAPVTLKLYGDLSRDEEYGASLRDLAQGDSRISFPGHFDNSEFSRIMSEIDVLLVPSIWYDFPLVVPSAFATHTPVIATDISGLNELVRAESDGLLIPRQDWQALGKCMMRFVETPKLLDRLRAGIRPTKTARQMGQEYLALYQSIASKTSKKVLTMLTMLLLAPWTLWIEWIEWMEWTQWATHGI